MRFFRACRRHRDEITSATALQGGEILECPQGHTVHSWDVINEKGEVVATAFEHERFILLPGEGQETIQRYKEEEARGRGSFQRVPRAPEDWEDLLIRWS